MKNTNANHTHKYTLPQMIYIVILLLGLIGASFYLGKITTEHNTPKTQPLHITTQTIRPLEIIAQDWWDTYCDSNVEIVDWNTDGNELAFMLSNGYELYAYKNANEYSNPSYIAFDSIADVSKADDGTITLTATDGNTYTVNP